MKLEKFHRMISHDSIELIKKTASRLGIQLSGKLKTCEDCILAKIKIKNLNKVSNSKSVKPGESCSFTSATLKNKVWEPRTCDY